MRHVRRLIIVGAGGFGREVYAYASEMIARGARWSLGGFLDRNSNALQDVGLSHGVIGDPESYQVRPNDVFICAIGDPTQKLNVASSLSARGAKFVNIIHPTAIVGPGCLLGEGLILCPYAVLTNHVTVGDHVVLNVFSSAGHDAVLGDGCTLSGHCDITGNARLGRGVFAGSHAVVLPGVCVGDYAVLGAGSVILRNVPSSTTVMGVPAKSILTHTRSEAAA